MTYSVVVCHFVGDGEVCAVDGFENCPLDVGAGHGAEVVPTAANVVHGEGYVNGDKCQLGAHGGGRHGGVAVGDGVKGSWYR